MLFSKWKIKALVQIILGTLPYGSEVNHLFQKYITRAFSPQSMLNSYRVQVRHVMALERRRSLRNETVLEIGPGAYSIAGVIFWLLGVRRQYWIDLNRYFRLPLFHRYIDVLLANLHEISSDLGFNEVELHKKLTDLRNCNSEEEYFTVSAITYFAPRDAQTTGLANNSVDLVYSYGVLEHIPTPVLENIMHESRRILTTGGRHYHNIGLHDHFHSAGLGNGVNFLRYSDSQWKFIAGNRFAYHNRLRRSDYLTMLDRHGAHITFSEDELLDINIRELAKIRLDRKFSAYDPTDLAYSHLFIEFDFGTSRSENSLVAPRTTGTLSNHR